MSGKLGGSRRAFDGIVRSRRRPMLEALEDRQLLATFTVTNNQDLFPNGTVVPGSLRDMIQMANLAGGSDTIAFNIAGTGVQTISVAAELPAITDSVRIDGTTQPGYSSTPLIELNGANTKAGSHGLRLASGVSVVDGLAINRFRGSGIRIDSSGNTILRSFIGTGSGGSTVLPNGDSGIYINGGSGNRIGGFDGKLGSLGNVISGNTGDGITIVGTGASSNVIQGNFLGTNSGGNQALANTRNGIGVSGASFTLIGGTEPGLSNVISGNSENGISVVDVTAQNTTINANFIGVDGNPDGKTGGVPTGGNAAIPNGLAGIAISGPNRTFIGNTNPANTNIISGNRGPGILLENANLAIVQGNIIGADRTGAGNLGNLGAGIEIRSDGVFVGGTLAGAANVIAWNGQPLAEGGVNVATGRRNAILSNSINNNFGPGIVLRAPSGVQPVPNDTGDLDFGPNDLQNYPVLTRAATAAGRTLIQGSLNSRPNATYTIQFFSSPVGDLNNFGEGQSLLGQTQVTTDALGNAALNVTLPTPAVVGQFVSATATDAANNTSGFAMNTQVVQANQANLAVDIATTSTATIGSDLVYVVTVVNIGPDPATNVTFTQTLPMGLTYKSSSPVLTVQAGSVVGNLGTIAPQGQVTVRVTVTPTAIGQVATTATVFSSEIDPETSSNSDTETTTINIPVDLGVALAPNPVNVTVGQNVTIQANVTNNFREDIGTGPATETVLELTLPPGVGFVSASAGQGSTSFSAGKVTARLGTIARGSTITVRVVATAPLQVPTSGDLTFSAVVSAAEIEPGGADPNPNTASVAVPVLPSSDLAVNFVANPEPSLAGSDLTYTYTVVNNGPSTATGVFLTDILPADLAFVSAPNPSQGIVTFETVEGLVVVTANLGTLAAGASATGFIVVRPSRSGIIGNTASLRLDQPDPDPTNNSATAIATVSPADLTITASAAPDAVEAGTNLSYTILVRNNGPADATGVVFRNVLPAGVTFVSAVAGQGTVTQQDGLVTANLGTIPSGASVPLTIVINPPAPAVLSSMLSVTSEQVDIRPADNMATVVTNVGAADLGVRLSVSPGNVLAGDSVTYTAVITNAGPFATGGVVFRDTLPAGLTLVSASASQGTVATAGNALTVDLGSLAVGGSATVTFVATPLSDGTFANTATVSGNRVDPAPANNSAQAGLVVVNAPGVLQFSASSFASPENSGQAVVTVTRTGGNLGRVTVNFATADGTAVAGRNYLATSGSLVFNNGETSKSFVVSLNRDGLIRGDLSLRLLLAGPAGGASLGANSAATLVIRDSDSDLTGPTVQDVLTQGNFRAVTGVSIVFDEALDPARATDPANYTLFAPARNGRGETRVPILAPSYDPATRTVTITAANRLALNTFYRVVVSGASSGVRDVSGNPIRGDASNTNGRDFVATFARGSRLRYRDGDGDAVSLNLSAGGRIDLARDADGEGRVLRILANGPRRRVLTGDVRRRSRASDGVTSFRSIVGAGFGGRVNSRLTTPEFFVEEVIASVRGTASGASVRAAAAPSPGGFAGRNLAHAFGKRVGR